MTPLLLLPKDKEELARVIEALKTIEPDQRTIVITPQEQAVLDGIAARA